MCRNCALQNVIQLLFKYHPSAMGFPLLKTAATIQNFIYIFGFIRITHLNIRVHTGSSFSIPFSGTLNTVSAKYLRCSFRQ
ncbi:hypothetical protein CS542_01770 [Pedobacter sp. IW39]|nr:hypothetical protein CS542_01770 [Pedobacter sp. IW39]